MAKQDEFAVRQSKPVRKSGTILTEILLGRKDMLKKCLIISGLGVFLQPSILPAQPVPATPSAHAVGPVKATTAPVAASGTTTPSDGAILGTLEGAINFCNRVSPQSMSSYKAVDQLFTKSQSAQVIAQVRSSDAYENNSNKVNKLLQALPASKAIAECNAH